MTDHSVGGYNVPGSEAGTARAQEVERRMAADREASRQRDADDMRRAQADADRAQAARNQQAQRAKQARPNKGAARPAPRASKAASTPGAPSEPGSMAGFFGFSGALAGGLFAGTYAWRNQTAVELAGKSKAPFMEAVQGAIELGGPDIWMPTGIAALIGGALLYHLYKPLLFLAALGAAGLVYGHGKKEGWF